jgi:hypothetical protein
VSAPPAEALLACAPLAGLAANVVVQVAVFRATRGVAFARSVAAGAATGAAVVAAVGAAAFLGAPAPLPVAAAVILLAGAHAGLTGCYFAFLNLNQTSLRVRVLKEIAASPAGSLALAELVRHYNADAVLSIRLERLVRGGHLVLDGGRYRLGARIAFLVLARFVDALKRLLIGARSALPPPPPG